LAARAARQKMARDSGLDYFFRGARLAVRENGERGAEVDASLAGFCERLRQNHPLLHETIYYGRPL
jgi:hypothetical protein